MSSLGNYTATITGYAGDDLIIEVSNGEKKVNIKVPIDGYMNVFSEDWTDDSPIGLNLVFDGHYY